MMRSLHRDAFILVASSIGAVLLLAFSTLAQPLRVQPIERTLGSSTIRGYVAVVDLCEPGVEVVVTNPLPAGSGVEANLIRTDTWQASTGVTLAVNANFFGTLSSTTADIIGLSVSDGVVVSPVRQFGALPDPAIVFKNDCTAMIGNIASNQLTNVRDAVAGVGPSNTDSIPGSFIVTNGVNTGATARVDPLNRNPRTAIGVSQDGKQLYIVVIDGRQANWSAGMTLPELADFMIERGAHNAINLDGGGSSSFIYQPVAGGPITANRPSDGAHRAVANHLGIRIPPQPVTLQKRPIRGVWLRPPSTIATLQTNLAQFAEAGITDLYLETFYHGISTGRAGIFNARFAFDYLAQAIVAAARYNIRVHAWCESGYWQFGSTGAYNFTNNPEWQSVNVATGQVGGDGTAGQVFANLANPGVQGKLRAYFAELAGYNGLWGIQTDYHRYALDNNTSDSFPAPWSYDTWTRATFQSMYNADPITAADTTADALWPRFLAFRRAGISQAANQMNLGIRSVNPSIEFSAAMFASAMSNSSQLTKCQDYYTWVTNNYVDTLVPMAYGSTVSSIRTDIALAKRFSAGKRVAAGLAIVGASPHPSIPDQLNGIKAEGIEDFVFFDGTAFANSTQRLDLKFWLLNQTTVQFGDYNTDGYIDARDRTLLNSVFSGTPVPVVPTNAKYDLNTDNVINSLDVVLFNRYFAKYRFGEDEVVDARDLAAMQACFGATPGFTGVHHLYDLTGDGQVNYSDQVVLHGLLTVSLPPDLDVNLDGRVTVDDVYVQAVTNGRDVNRDGVVNSGDLDTLEAAVRAGEAAGMTSGRE